MPGVGMTASEFPLVSGSLAFVPAKNLVFFQDSYKLINRWAFHDALGKPDRYIPLSQNAFQKRSKRVRIVSQVAECTRRHQTLFASGAKASRK